MEKLGESIFVTLEMTKKERRLGVIPTTFGHHERPFGRSGHVELREEGGLVIHAPHTRVERKRFTTGTIIADLPDSGVEVVWTMMIETRIATMSSGRSSSTGKDHRCECGYRDAIQTREIPVRIDYDLDRQAPDETQRRRR